MDNSIFLQTLCALSLEDGQAYFQEHTAELTNHAEIGMLIKDEALRQRDTNPFTSLKLAEMLISFGKYVQHIPSYALGLAAKGDALSAMAHEKAAIECFDAAAEQFLRLGDEFNWARTRVGWIISYAWLGHVDEALREAARARRVFEQLDEPYWVCNIDHNTAVIYTQTGQYRKALELYERTLALYPTLTGENEFFIKRAVAMVEVNQARNFTWLGDFERAKQLFQKALVSFNELGQMGFVITTEINLAHLDYIQGYYGSALRRYYQIRDSVQQRNLDKGLLATVSLRIANCLVKLNRAREAVWLSSDAVNVYRQIGVSLELGNVLREHAAALIAAGRLKDATVVLNEAGELFDGGGFVHHASAAKLQHAELLLEMGHMLEAYDHACLLKKHFDTQGFIAYSADVSLIMAGSLVRQVQEWNLTDQKQWLALQEANSLCEQVLTAAKEHRLREQAYKSQYLLGQIATLQEYGEQAEQHYADAIEQIEYILDDLALDLRSAFLRSTWRVYEAMVALCLQKGKIEQAFSYLERARSTALRQYLDRSKSLQLQNETLQARNATLFRLQNELNEWQGFHRTYSAQLAALDTSDTALSPETFRMEIRRCETKISELFERLHLSQSADVREKPFSEHKRPPAHDIDIERLRQQLDSDQLLLAYFLYREKLIIFAVTRERIITYENADGVAQLERLLPPLYAHLEPRGWINPELPPVQAIRRLLQKLYRILIEPVSTLLPSSSGLLTIVPYGSLHNLPFHALYDGTRFLVENFQMNYLPASSLWLRLSRPRSVTTQRSPLVLGYSGGHLQRALVEAETLTTMLGGQCYLESEATIARLIDEAAGCPIIHLATHGHCRLDAPNFSYVRLADGQLNAIDAFNLDLEECELVTLSGCETGLALSSGGDEQIGLGRAFLASGTASLVMSLWPVEDNATSEFMQFFYQCLLSGYGEGQALRAAQCHFLQQESPLYVHPYFWAAFHLVGDVGPLSYLRTLKPDMP